MHYVYFCSLVPSPSICDRAKRPDIVCSLGGEVCLRADEHRQTKRVIICEPSHLENSGKDGYSGSAEAFVCGRDGEPYELFGCDTTTSTLTTTTTTTETTTTTSTYTTTTTSTSTVTSTTSTSTTTETTTSTTTTTETTTSTTTSTTILSCMEVVDKAYQVTVNSLEARNVSCKIARCELSYVSSSGPSIPSYGFMS